MDAFALADACQALAENLDKEQAAESYSGTQAVALGKLATNLCAQASALRTIGVSGEISSAADAVNSLQAATKAATAAAGNLKNAADAIKIAGLVLSLGAAVVTGSPGGVISSAESLVSAVEAL